MAGLEDTRAEYRETMAHFRVLLTLRVGILSVFTIVLGGIGRLTWEVYIANPDLVYNELVQRFRVVVPWSALAGILIVTSVDMELLRIHRITLRRLWELEEILGIEGVHTYLGTLTTLAIPLIIYELIYGVAMFVFGTLTLVEIIHMLLRR